MEIARTRANAAYDGARRRKSPLDKNGALRTRKSGAVFVIKFCLISLIVTSVLVLILSAQNQVDAKKLKLKDLKKLKKYAFFLATKRNRLYAIPFPVPLPVFVKRQHIYTQVPVVPRYVQRPYTYQQHSSDQQDSYASASSQQASTPASSSQSAPSYSATSNEITPAATYQPSVKGAQQRPSKYLSQLANAMGYSNPVLGSMGGVGGIVESQRDMVNKLLSGQAKLVAPNMSTLFASLKHQQQQQKEYSHHRQKAYEGAQESPEIQSEASKESAQIAGRANNSNSTRQHSERVHGPPADLYPGLPLAALRKSAQLAELYRLAGPAALPLPYAQLASARAAAAAAAIAASSVPANPQVAQLMQLVEPQQAESSETVEVRVRPDAVEAEMAQSADQGDIEVAPGLAARYTQEQVLHALQRLEQQRLILTQLIKEREEAQMAESNSVALAAQQLGIPLIPAHIRLANFQT